MGLHLVASILPSSFSPPHLLHQIRIGSFLAEKPTIGANGICKNILNGNFIITCFGLGPPCLMDLDWVAPFSVGPIQRMGSLVASVRRVVLFPFIVFIRNT